LEEALGSKLEAFDEDARFISLGLDSLLLTQLARMVRLRLGFNVTFRQLTEHYSTPRLLAEAIRGTSAPRPSTRAPVTGLPSTQPPPSSVREAAPVESSGSRGRSFHAPATNDSALKAPYSDARLARLGRAADGRLAWFLPDPVRPGSYVQVASDE
jgi:aryl carrier-like protein